MHSIDLNKENALRIVSLSVVLSLLRHSQMLFYDSQCSMFLKSLYLSELSVGYKLIANWQPFFHDNAFIKTNETVDSGWNDVLIYTQIMVWIYCFSAYKNHLLKRGNRRRPTTQSCCFPGFACPHSLWDYGNIVLKNFCNIIAKLSRSSLPRARRLILVCRANEATTGIVIEHVVCSQRALDVHNKLTELW